MITDRMRPRRPGLLFFAILISFFAILAPACTPRQTIAWRAVGAAELWCAVPAIQGVVSVALSTLARLAAGVSVDYAAVGTSLVAQYGPVLALCAVERGWEAWSGAMALPGATVEPAAPPGAREAVRWLHDHRGAWLPRGR